MKLAELKKKPDISGVIVRGYTLYQEGKYRDAIPVLQHILDIEPGNWHARLLLGASFFKTGQEMAAERAFRYIYESCTDREIAQKACLAHQAATAAFEEKTLEIPPEFGSIVERIRPARIESIISYFRLRSYQKVSRTHKNTPVGRLKININRERHQRP